MIEWSALVGATALIVYGIVIYNRLVRDRQRTRAGWSDIEVQLKRRPSQGDAGLIESHYSHPRWYHTRNYHGSDFSSALSNSFDSAIASSSVAPGSSSGSSGGGGGGW
jgi:LemA protein